MAAYVDSPELVHGVARVVTDYTKEAIDLGVGMGADVISLDGDLAFNTNTIMSPDQFREYVKPYYTELVDHVHGHGLRVFKHSDGDHSRITQDLVETGIDGLHPIQPQCLDMATMKREYGDRLCLLGNIDCIDTLVTGSELKEVVRGAAWGGALQGVTLSVQALVGIGLYVLFRAAGTERFPTFGLFPPLGFTQGPGQALSIGKVWEGFGFANAATIGLTFASIGFAFAFFVGAPLVNWGIRKLGRDGKPVELSPALRKGYVPKDEVGDSAGN